MQELDPIEKWLNVMFPDSSAKKQLKESYRETVYKFAAFVNMSPQQIIFEKSRMPGKSFKKKYADLLLSFTTQLQKHQPPNLARKQIDIIRSFFTYYKLPLGFGAKAHFQFLLK